MSPSRNLSNGGTMLDLWRPPRDAGEPAGCLATTFTFAPGLFDEQCLARFLEIESEPNRESLAFLLEREKRLGGVYAAVLVDHTQAGVEHSLRWDVLPVRIRGGKQHAKLSLLVWSRHIRLIVASANLTEPGYRSNREVTGVVDLGPDGADHDLLGEASTFLRRLIRLVPGAAEDTPEVRRALEFLERVERQAKKWRPAPPGAKTRQRLAFTIPSTGARQANRSTLDEAVLACRKSMGSLPHEVWIASPFFDQKKGASMVAEALCNYLARGHRCRLRLCVPAGRDEAVPRKARLMAPIALLDTMTSFGDDVSVRVLPDVDGDKNLRPWHAKMLALHGRGHTALMVGSSNFTCAGMGVGARRNAEANLLTIIKLVRFGRTDGELEAIWPAMDEVENPGAAEWIGALKDREEEEQANGPPLPAGFLAATYRAGDSSSIILRFDPGGVPAVWTIHSCGRESRELLSGADWKRRGRPPVVDLPWPGPQPPELLLVRWDKHEGFLPLNVEDSRCLPPPVQLEGMSADDMLGILAAADPSAAFRTWARRQQPSAIFDEDVDSADPPDLDPLGRYDLQATFLHRVRRRATLLARVRAGLQQPVWSRQALEWRLRGLIGVQATADRLVGEMAEMAKTDGKVDEALLSLADFLIVLGQVEYQTSDGALRTAEFEAVYRPFLAELAGSLRARVELHRDHLSEDLLKFWNRVVKRCRE